MKKNLTAAVEALTGIYNQSPTEYSEIEVDDIINLLPVRKREMLRTIGTPPLLEYANKQEILAAQINALILSESVSDLHAIAILVSIVFYHEYLRRGYNKWKLKELGSEITEEVYEYLHLNWWLCQYILIIPETSKSLPIKLYPGYIRNKELSEGKVTVLPDNYQAVLNHHIDVLFQALFENEWLIGLPIPMLYKVDSDD